MAVLANVAQGLTGLLRRRPRCLALDALIKDIEVATTNGTAEDQLTLARDYQRKAQFFLDYVVSENSRGFHAPAYTLRILNDGTDSARRGQLALRGLETESYTLIPSEAPAT